MRRYIRNKGGSIVYQRDVTQRFPGADGIWETVTKQKQIVLQFEPLLGGPYGDTPWDMPTAIEAFAGSETVPMYAAPREVVGADGLVANSPPVEPMMVTVRSFDRGAKKRGLVRADGQVVGDEEQMNPMYGLWVLDVDEFVKKLDGGPDTPEAREELAAKIEQFLDNPDLQRGDYYAKVSPRVALPSPNYLSLKGGGRGITLPVRIADAIREGFLDAAQVIMYETYHPRDKSDEIIAAAKAVQQEQAAPPPVEAPELVEA